MSFEEQATHPLNTPWTLWFYAVPSSGYRPMNYSEYLRNVYTFDCVGISDGLSLRIITNEFFWMDIKSGTYSLEGIWCGMNCVGT